MTYDEIEQANWQDLKPKAGMGHSETIHGLGKELPDIKQAKEPN